jgi:polynucleotide 5'-kinase involved in rRNA processing
MDSSYPALHKFLLPNTKLEDVMVNMNDFKNEASKPSGIETSNVEENKSNEKPVIPRRQKRLNERIQHKLGSREDRKQKREAAVRLEKGERLRRIKEQTSKTSGLQDDDLERIKRIVHGVGTDVGQV